MDMRNQRSQPHRPRPSQGDRFEEEIADLYRLLGYRVQCNLLLCGQQVVLYLEFPLPAGQVARTMVECKYRESGNIGNDVVNEFYGAFSNAQRQNLVDYGIIVTNRDFTAAAKSTATRTNLSLLTRVHILSNLIDFTDYLRRVVHDYENYDEMIRTNAPFVIDIMERCDLNRYYVPLRCSHGKKKSRDLEK